MEKLYDRTLLYSGSDEFGPVEVVEDNSRRSLHFGNSLQQSEMLLTDPNALVLIYTKHMAMSLLFHDNIKSALFLGLGGGSVIKFLWKNYPDCKIDVVERSPLVVQVCKEYFALPQDGRINIHLEDAQEYLRTETNQYDLIFLDIFGKDGISSSIGERNFFKSCKELLRDKNSILVWNTWRYTSKEFMEKSIRQIAEVFGNNLIILPDEFGNYVFLIFSQPIKQTIKITKNKAIVLTIKTGLDFSKILDDLNDLKDLGLKEGSQ